ncbi:TPA: glutamine--tRNA ligase [Neisseria subflava]|uniref:glutamine--tRNA ligase n=1 Tax=unclassified Neisseria TaxID=2623750 RepID=UPI0008A520B4|nr:MULTISPECIES: glutamine--tRNA ligase [unclassified Neisseria]OFR83306.1 glutamine--tRNA ligase [Neisseria sp. HMSC073G10]OHO84122.1 glutamine--tRNA ligase [Neisseria sp. HMSC056A04]
MLNKDQFADNHFIRTIIEEDLKSGKHTAIQTRFPPEPNGYLHIGHAKSICLNFGLAYIYDGLCNLRFDDTNPEKENDEYVNAIKEDVEWLGFHWAGEPRFASNYFDQLYDYAVGLIKDGKAYVDDLTPEEMREYRGTLTEAGKNSPYRDRSIEENLDLFTRMKNGEFPDGSKTLRLKIDMASGNINMRDPVIYRIRRAHHHNTGDKWCIYPMYDYTHCISDAIEGITHSLCTLEFEAHRPLYDWVVDNIIVTNDKTRLAINRLSYILSNLQSKYIQLDLGNNINKHIEIYDEIYNEISNMRMIISFQLKNLKLESKLNVNILQKLVDISLRSYEGGFWDEEWTRIAELISDYSNLIKEIMSLLSPFPNRPRQYEFSRLELLYSITSKRKLNQLVSDGHVAGWDDPRMPTISGMRRRGYTPEGLRLFAKRAGISKSENIVDMSVLEGAIREELENSAPRLMAVLNPLKVTLTNFEAGKTQSRRAAFHPNHEEMGEREIPVSQTIYIEADDFAENPPKGFKRLIPGGEVRLRHGYVIKCDEVVKGEAGNVVELKCSIDHDTLGKNPEGRKVKGVIHWVSAEHAAEIKVRLYDRLFTVERPDAVRGEDGNYLPFTDFLNPESIKEITAYAEPVAKDLPAESRWQFERIGYFVTDRKDHSSEHPVFNRTVTLKDSWQPK